MWGVGLCGISGTFAERDSENAVGRQDVWRLTFSKHMLLQCGWGSEGRTTHRLSLNLSLQVGGPRWKNLDPNITVELGSYTFLDRFSSSIPNLTLSHQGLGLEFKFGIELENWSNKKQEPILRQSSTTLGTFKDSNSCTLLHQTCKLQLELKLWVAMEGPPNLLITTNIPTIWCKFCQM